MVLNKIKVLRAEHNLTQEQLAQAVGVIRQTIIAIEQGKYQPSIGLALKIADYFKVPVESVFSLKKS